MSQYIPGFDPCVEELGRPEVADVGVRYDCNDEISDSPLRFGEEFIILAFCLVDGLFLGSGGILEGRRTLTKGEPVYPWV